MSTKPAGTFPEDPEKRMRAVLECTNLDPRAITLAFCLDRPGTASDIMERFEYLAGGAGWIPRDRSIFSCYCNKVFLPAGVVAKDSASYTHAFSLTAAGKEYAKPVAALELRFAVERGRSIYDYLGSNGNFGNTAGSYNRVAILDSVRSGCKRLVEISSETGLSKGSVSAHVRALENLGLIEYAFVNPEESGIYYHIYQREYTGEPPPCRRDITMSRRVAAALRKLGRANAHGIAKELGMETTGGIQRISGILSHYSNTGFSTRERWKAGEDQSCASIIREGEETLDIFDAIRHALSGDIDPREFLSFFEHGDRARGYACAAMDRYAKVAPVGSLERKEERKRQILAFVDSNGRAPRTKEIEEHLGVAPDVYLRALIAEGKLARERQGKAVLWYICPGTIYS